MAAVNTIGDFIRSVFPSIVNKNGLLFKALLADKECGTGTIETVFNDIEKERKAGVENKNAYKQSGEQLKRALDVFSVVSPLEDYNAFKNINKLLFTRNGAGIWGNRRDILNLFRAFFNNENVYLVNNTEPFSENLILDGSFEAQNAWMVAGGAIYEREARFDERMGVKFQAAGICSQSVNVEKESTYFLHFFMKGRLRVQIKDNEGHYWNTAGGKDGEGAWSAHEYAVSFVSENWENKSVFFFTYNAVSSITVTFLYEPGYYAFLDYVRLNKKTQVSTFSIIAVFKGTYSDDTTGLAPGTNDDIVAFDYSNMGYFSSEKGGENMTYADGGRALAPNLDDCNDKNVDYEKVPYFDSSCIYGSAGKDGKELAQEVLDIVKAAGTAGNIEILVKAQDA